MAAEKTPLLAESSEATPPAPFTKAIVSPAGVRLPQTIGHRGYNAAFPENSMGAFRGAIAVGAHAVETDLHLSKDGVVVLSHDPSLKRCFGKDEKIADCDWSYLSTLKTTREPQEALPRLSDLLEYLAQPGLELIWVLLDIKLDDDPEALLSGVAKTIASVTPSRPWKERIVLGAWNEPYMDFCREILPGFPLAFIGVSLSYASRFLKQPQVNFNLLQKSLVGPLGRRFMKSARRAERNLFVWTVNHEPWMEWSIRKQVDGVITDDPKRFLELCDRVGGGGDAAIPAGSGGAGRMTRAKLYVDALVIQLLIIVVTGLFGNLFKYRGKKAKVSGVPGKG